MSAMRLHFVCKKPGQLERILLQHPSPSLTCGRSRRAGWVRRWRARRSRAQLRGARTTRRWTCCAWSAAWAAPWPLASSGPTALSCSAAPPTSTPSPPPSGAPLEQAPFAHPGSPCVAASRPSTIKVALTAPRAAPPSLLLPDPPGLICTVLHACAVPSLLKQARDAHLAGAVFHGPAL